MNLLVNGHNVFLIVLVTFVTSVILVPLVMKAAKHVNAMDIPNQRSAHTKPMPRMGGLAIFGAFLLNQRMEIKYERPVFRIGSFKKCNR